MVGYQVICATGTGLSVVTGATGCVGIPAGGRPVVLTTIGCGGGADWATPVRTAGFAAGRVRRAAVAWALADWVVARAANAPSRKIVRLFMGTSIYQGKVMVKQPGLPGRSGVRLWDAKSQSRASAASECLAGRP
jgi:hypothetical protein